MAQWMRWSTIGLAVLFASVWAATQAPQRPAPLAKINANYVGSKICFECHLDVARLWAEVPHSQWMLDEKMPVSLRGCEACHGPGSTHVLVRAKGNIVAWETMDIKDQNDICLQCHTKVTAEKWNQSPHAKAKPHPLACVSCHEVHQPVERRWMLKDEGDKLCLKCHHDIPARAKVNQHHPVGSVVRCAACHDPHDATIPGMLKVAVKELCQRCHALEDIKPEDHTPEFVKEHGKKFKPTNRRCISCHGRNGCQECHGVEMPHPKGFGVKHGEPTFQNPQVCSRCHKQDFCNKCHSEAPPSSHESEDYATKGHAEEYRQRTAAYCGLCHQRSFCAPCHRGKLELLETIPE